MAEELFERCEKINSYARNIDGGMGQSFTVGETGPSKPFTPTRIELKLARDGYPDKIELELRETKFGSAIATGEITDMGRLEHTWGEYDWTSIELSGSPTLQPGATYYIRLLPVGEDENNIIRWNITRDYNIPGGRFYLVDLQNDIWWKQRDDITGSFRLYGTEVTPENTVGTINESRSSFPSSGTTGQPVDIDIYWGNSGSEAGTCYLRIYEYPGTLNENLLFSKDKQFAAGEGTSTVASSTVPDVDTWPLGVKVWGDDESEPSWGSSASAVRQWQLSTSPLEKPPLWQMAAIPVGLIAVGALIEYR